MNRPRKDYGCPFNVRTYRGIYYFRSYEEARDYAHGSGYPTNRIFHYERGWAIQAEPSGDYAGPHGLKFRPQGAS